MKCTECVQSGQRSKVFDRGGTRTLMGGRGTFFGEDGERHHHDPNITTSGYECSNGHMWAVKSKTPCPNPKCEYGKTPEQIADQQKPQCCGGGPQWGHQITCPKCPD